MCTLLTLVKYTYVYFIDFNKVYFCTLLTLYIGYIYIIDFIYVYFIDVNKVYMCTLLTLYM